MAAICRPKVAAVRGPAVNNDEFQRNALLRDNAFHRLTEPIGAGRADEQAIPAPKFLGPEDGCVPTFAATRPNPAPWGEPNSEILSGYARDCLAILVAVFRDRNWKILFHPARIGPSLPVCATDRAIFAIEIIGLFNTTFAIFRCRCLLIANFRPRTHNIIVL